MVFEYGEKEREKRERERGREKKGPFVALGLREDGGSRYNDILNLGI